jgi:hypothetical protein
MTTSLPYGPNSAAIRRFLVQLAGLGVADRARVVMAYGLQSTGRPWMAAEQAMAEAITRGDREGYRDALSGPLMQLVRIPGSAEPITDEEALATLEPIAEPALAALLALVVGDLIPEEALTTLLAPFAGVVDARPVN